MSKSFSHSCIKCNEIYKDEDPEPYYCQSCNEQRLAIAKEIDSKPRPQKRETVSALQEYDRSPKIRGFVHVKL